jgi:hypothetical protein
VGAEWFKAAVLKFYCARIPSQFGVPGSPENQPKTARAAICQYQPIPRRATELGSKSGSNVPMGYRPTKRHEIWRAELDRLGAWAVQKKLDQAGVGHGALVPGFLCGGIERGFIEEWLADRENNDAKRQRATLRWARIAGLLTIIGLFVSIGGILLSAESRHTLGAIARSLRVWFSG